MAVRVDSEQVDIGVVVGDRGDVRSLAELDPADLAPSLPARRAGSPPGGVEPAVGADAEQIQVGAASDGAERGQLGKQPCAGRLPVAPAAGLSPSGAVDGSVGSDCEQMYFVFAKHRGNRRRRREHTATDRRPTAPIRSAPPPCRPTTRDAVQSQKLSSRPAARQPAPTHRRCAVERG